MSKKALLALVLVLILGLGAGMGTMALYKSQFDTASNSVTAARFNPVITTDEDEWSGQAVFDEIFLAPGTNDDVGTFDIDFSDIQTGYTCTMSLSINEELAGAPIAVQLYANGKPYAPVATFAPDEKNIIELKEALGTHYQLKILWDRHIGDEMVESEDGTSYSKDALYAGKTGDIVVNIEVKQEEE